MSDSAALIDWEQLEMIFGEDDEDFDEDEAPLSRNDLLTRIKEACSMADMPAAA